LHALRREKFALLSLATFNKKIHELVTGKDVVDEQDDLPPANFEVVLESENGDDDSRETGEFV
jgi:hypothetical protein